MYEMMVLKEYFFFYIIKEVNVHTYKATVFIKEPISCYDEVRYRYKNVFKYCSSKYDWEQYKVKCCAYHTKCKQKYRS